MINPWTYLGSVSTSAILSGSRVHMVDFCGQAVEADVEVVRRLMADSGVPPEEQVGLWVGLWRQWPDPGWGEQCMAEAERVEALLKRAAALAHTAHGGTVAQAPAAAAMDKVFTPFAERHFVWLGERKGLTTEILRNGIAGLARIGMIRSDRGQQDALRRGLGLTLNDAERNSDAPWVDWLGPADMLARLVDRLWEMDLITCAGGRQQKWRTATGVFRRADGTRYDLTLRNSRCTDSGKLSLLDEALFSGLRFYLGG